jgi:hypothetical protein
MTAVYNAHLTAADKSASLLSPCHHLVFSSLISQIKTFLGLIKLVADRIARDLAAGERFDLEFDLECDFFTFVRHLFYQLHRVFVSIEAIQAIN